MFQIKITGGNPDRTCLDGFARSQRRRCIGVSAAKLNTGCTTGGIDINITVELITWSGPGWQNALGSVVRKSDIIIPDIRVAVTHDKIAASAIGDRTKAVVNIAALAPVSGRSGLGQVGRSVIGTAVKKQRRTGGYKVTVESGQGADGQISRTGENEILWGSTELGKLLQVKVADT